MAQPIVYIDTSTVRKGKLDQLKEAMGDLAQFVEANMPRLLSYAFFLDNEQTEMTVVAVHPDSASLRFHLDTGADEFRKFATLLKLERIEVYGRISADVLERLQQKAEMLGSGTVSVHEFYAGFVRASEMARA